nr:MAG TPA: hypothetical protein [Caudoviricetes sp.]
MQVYKDKLYATLKEISERPVSMYTVEQAAAVTDLLCRLHELDEHEPEPHRTRETREEHGFTREDAEAWVRHMKNEDPEHPHGAMWSEAQCLSVAASAGIDLHDIPGYVFWAAMNMEWSDGWRVARDFGVDQPQYYARQAEAFLRDKDAGGPEEKICAYYRYVAGASK